MSVSHSQVSGEEDCTYQSPPVTTIPAKERRQRKLEMRYKENLTMSAVITPYFRFLFTSRPRSVIHEQMDTVSSLTSID